MNKEESRVKRLSEAIANGDKKYAVARKIIEKLSKVDVRKDDRRPS